MVDPTECDRIKSAFGQLCSLVGKWADTNSTTTVEFRKSAHDSILVETWMWPEKKIEALTIYHLDGSDLIATHYCPIGNQPRLKFVDNKNMNRLLFRFVSATNLPDHHVDHCESFWFEITNADLFTRSETYTGNGDSETQQSSYRRLEG